MSDMDRQNQAIIEQKNGKYTVKFNLPAGEFNSHQLRHIAKCAKTYGDGIMQVNFRQSFEIRDIAKSDIPKLTYDMDYINIGLENSAKYQNIVACPGADQCNMGVAKTLSLAGAMNQHLEAKLNKTKTLANMTINLSGCGNGCTHPLINDIGMIGAVGRIDGKKVLGWNLHLGGKLGEEQVIGLVIGFISETKAIQALDTIVDTYLNSGKTDISLQNWLTEHGNIHVVTEALRSAGLLYPTLNEAAE